MVREVLQQILVTLVQFIFRFIAPFVVPFALLLSIYDEKLKGKRLPDYLSWFSTPDDLDVKIQGRYEPTIKKIEDKYGWFIASWVWLGFRNVLHGFCWSIGGKEVPNYLVHLTEAQQKELGIYRKETKVGFLKVITGWTVHKDPYSVYTNNGFWATPTFSVRLWSQD